MEVDFILHKFTAVAIILTFGFLGFLIFKKGSFGIALFVFLFFTFFAGTIFFSSSNIILTNQVSPGVWVGCDGKFYKENPPEKIDRNTSYSYRDLKCVGWTLNHFTKWEYVLNDPYDSRVAKTYVVSAESENEIATVDGEIISLWNPLRETIYMSSDRFWKEKNGDKIQSILIRCIVPADKHFPVKIQTVIFA